MSNDTVPAAAEGMPAPMHRRTFLKGAAVALALPAPAMATASPKPDKLTSMILRHKQLAEECEAADLASFNVFHRGDRPEEGYVTAQEFGKYFWPVVHGRYNMRTDIDKVIDQYLKTLRWNYEEIGNRTFELKTREREAEAHRAGLHKLFDERQAAYDAWAASSGYAASIELVTQKTNRYFDLQDEIINFPCTTIAELSTKAGFIIAEWGDEFAPERQLEFMREVAAFAKKMEAA